MTYFVRRFTRLWIAATATISFTSPLAAVAQPPAAAPASADADPALWVVRDEDTIIYLFGTFHLVDSSTDWFNDEVREAFDRSRELVLEVDMPTDPTRAETQLQPLIRRYAIDGKGRTISSRLTPDQNRLLNEALSTIGIASGSYDRMEPWFINMMMTRVLGKRMGAGIESGADSVLRRAAGRRMRFQALEKAEDQFRMFDSLPEESQLAQLKLMLDNWDALGSQLPRMLNVWKRGDAEGLDRILNAGLRGDPRLRRALLEDRNRAWVEWIVRRLERPGMVFMAVGAGHLVGSDSVQTLLEQRGITSTRVPNAEARRSYPRCRTKSDDRCSQQR